VSGLISTVRADLFSLSEKEDEGEYASCEMASISKGGEAGWGVSPAGERGVLT